MKPVVFHKTTKVNSEDAAESVGVEGDKECPEEEEGMIRRRRRRKVGLTMRTKWMSLVCCIFSMRNKFL